MVAVGARSVTSSVSLTTRIDAPSSARPDSCSQYFFHTFFLRRVLFLGTPSDMKPDRIPFSVRIQPYHKSRIMQIATKLKKTHGEVIEQLLDLAAEQLLKKEGKR